MDVIAKFKDICRACMKTTENMYPIFDLFADQHAMCEIFPRVSNTQLERDDGLADTICSECADLVANAHKFQEMCIASDTTMREAIMEQELINAYGMKEEIVADQEDVEILPFQCAHCLKTYKSRHSLSSHMRVHSIAASNPHYVTCAKCEEGFSNIDLLAVHFEKEHPDKVEEVVIEKKEFPELDLIEEDETCEISLDNEMEDTKMFDAVEFVDDADNVGEQDMLNIESESDEELLTKPKTEVDHNWGDKELISKPKTRANHKCLVCTKLFAHRFRLERHMKLHDPEGKPFECAVGSCRIRFTDENLLKRHSVRHREDIKQLIASNALEKPESFKCSDCSKIFKKLQNLTAHKRMHTGAVDNVYPCSICDTVFPSANRLYNHKKTHNRLKCDLCEKSFTSKARLIEHRLVHTGDHTYDCDECGHKSKNLAMLKRHLKRHDGDSMRNHLCPECGKRFDSAGNLQQHILRHGGLKNIQCPKCPSKFVTRNDLCSHLAVHAKVKAHFCDVCGGSFTKAYSLKMHMRIHTGYRPYKCDYCEKSFIISDHCKRHMRTHTGVKPYECQYCDRAFAQTNDLVKHLRSHLGANTYKCDKCDSAFRLKVELRDHMEMHFNADNQA